jgi:hypothetical protein
MSPYIIIYQIRFIRPKLHSWGRYVAKHIIEHTIKLILNGGDADSCGGIGGAGG